VPVQVHASPTFDMNGPGVLSTSATAPAVLDGALALLPASDTAETIRGSIEDVDPQIVEALKSKDRLFVLKLGEIMETLISQRLCVVVVAGRLIAHPPTHRPRMDIQPASSYQRLLVHRCAAYYKFTPETESNSKVLYLTLTAESAVCVSIQFHSPI
jgi:hypothetical protein